MKNRKPPITILIAVLIYLTLTLTSCSQETDCSVCNSATMSTFNCGNHDQCVLAYPTTPGGMVKCMCKEDLKPQPKNECNDGVLNYDEEDVDCGGATCQVCDCTVPEKKCRECNDGFISSTEAGVDCGGSCPVCYDKFSYTVQHFGEEDIIIDVPLNVLSNLPEIRIAGQTTDGWPGNIDFTFDGEALGTYPIKYAWAGDLVYKGVGEVTVTKIDKANRRISGTFYLTVGFEFGSESYNITDGIFSNYRY